MANVNSIRSQYSPVVRDGLCRKIRSKGMLVHIDDGPGKGSSSRQAYLEIDQNALDYDGTTWWCTETSKTIGPDDRPCDETRCGSKTKRACYRGEEPVA
jgi:hypothetical protein